MSNTITAYFKGRVGVAESVYQNDYGIVMAFDSIDLPAHFDCYFSRLNQEEALPGLGADNRVTIPNSILANPGNVTIHIPLHTGEDDSEVEYVIYFKVIGRARPIDDGTPAQMTAIERALALLSQPITNIEEIVNEALSFTGDTFAEMKQELADDFAEYKGDVDDDIVDFKTEIRGDIADVEHDFTVLQGQFDTAVAAVSTDTELTDIRVGDDEVTYTTAGAAVRGQFHDVKSALNVVYDAAVFQIELSQLYAVTPFMVDSGETVTVKAKDGSTMTVNQIKFRRANGTEDYWTISNYAERKITMTEPFVAVYLNGGTAQNIVVSKNGSYIASKEDVNSVSADVTETNANLSVVETMVSVNKPTFTATSGYYISDSGAITSGGSFSYSEPIAVSAGDKVEFLATGYNTAVAMISLCDSDGTNIIPKVISVATPDTKYEYDVISDGYIVLSYATAYAHELTIIADKISKAENTLSKVASTNNVTPTNLNIGFIHRDGRIMDGSNFRYTDPIRLENETITFTAKGYNDVVSLLSTCDADGNNRINIVNSTSEEPTKTINYASNGVTYVIISSGTAQPIHYSIVKSIAPKSVPMVNLSLFQKFGVIGDSFASGTLFFNSTSKDDYAHSWGQIMARSLGTVCTNYSKGGLSTRTWLTDAKGLSLLLTNPPEDIYYLVLGINDSHSLGTDYLGSLTDITSHSSYEEYADSFYGNYGRIIEQIQAHAPHAKIVMFTLAHNFNATAIAYSEAIVEIANYYNIPYINQRDDEFFNSTFFWENLVEGHPIAIGYSGMASAFERLLNDCLKNNVAYFKDAFCYA